MYPLILIFMSFAALADSAVVLSVASKKIGFTHDSARNLFISSDCTSQCMALKAFQDSIDHPGTLKVSKKHAPGTQACTERFHGKVVIGVDENRNERGLCRFSDGSMLGLGSLSYANRELRR